MSEKASWKFEEGDEIVPGRFALKKLGGGKRYEAYLGWDDKLFSQVVIKVLRPDQAEEEKAVRDLEREANVIARLSHPMLVRSFDAMLGGERPHIVLEFFEGPTLRKLIKGYGPLQIEQVVPLATKLFGVLHYIASESLVHLDVKPGNIVMEAPPKLIDLSVARTLDVAAKLTKRVGTRAYMAPEQCKPGKHGTVGPPADVWGAGVTLYEAVTGQRAFPSSREDGDNYPQVSEDLPPFPKDTPGAVEEMIRACVDKDPARRPAAAEVAAGFEPLLGHIPERPRLRRARPRLR